MTNMIKNKLSIFIDDLFEHRLEHLEIDVYTDKKKKLYYYSIDIDTSIPIKSLNTFGLTLLTQKIHFCVCPQSGLVLLTRDDFNEYRSEDFDIANKYSKIISDAFIKRQK